MSGHSHFKSIKYKKGLADAKRGNVFSKMSKEITVAAKEGGGDINFNAKLRMAVERAKEFNMPKENVERAIKKGTGELAGEALENITVEAYGPGGVAIVVEGITDNKNRALGEIKKILAQNNNKLVGEGGVQWMFERTANKETCSLEWLAKQNIEISEKDKEACQKLFEDLDENEAVQEIYSNFKE